jgi:hypothetical protein
MSDIKSKTKRFLCDICSVLQNKRVYHNTKRDLKLNKELKQNMKELEVKAL